jgi:uncharacterized repeat protein (TIGR03803 family)
MLTLVAAATAHAQTYAVLYNFDRSSGDFPQGILAQGVDGNLYGMLSPSGSLSPVDVYGVTPSGSLTLLHDFSPPNADMIGGVTLGTDARFYGVVRNEALDSGGVIFKLTRGGNLTILYSFTGGADGRDPLVPPIEGIDGNFYGTTSGGGSNPLLCESGCGTVYKMTPSGSLTTLHSFNGTDGGSPHAPLVQAANGNLYGTTNSGGVHNYGTIFEVSSSGKFSVVFDFHGTDGWGPAGGLVQADDGDLYGTTAGGGANDDGVVFKISHGTYSVVHSFIGGTDGIGPLEGLVEATDGNVYGTTALGTCGDNTIFRITPSGDFATLYTFLSDASLGCEPQSPLLQRTDGLLYGTAAGGGSFNGGVFFSFDVGLGPFVTFLPAARQVGHTVEILGQGFTGTTAVSFNGTPAAAFNVLTDTFLTATVPNGATTGFITVTTPSGTLTSNRQFQVKPQITSFSPTSGPVGTSVVVTGVSLSQTSKITFNSVVATSFTVDSDTQVTVTVPAGATTAKIGVTTTGAPVYSGAAFTVTQ